MDWEALEATATALLVVVGTWQIWAIRVQAKVERTLNACIRYDSDPVIGESTRRLREAQNSGDIIKNPRSHRYDVVALLNYLDTIAIGIEQRLYIDSLAYDYLKNIVKLHCNEYLSTSVADTFDINLDNYSHLADMRSRWARDRPRFRDGWLVTFGRRL